MRRVVAVIAESVRTAVSQPVASILTLVIIAGMCASVLLTTGKTVGAEESVLGSIDSNGTRSIVVRAQPGSGLTESVLQRLSGVGGIQWAGAFGPATDVHNAAIKGGTRVAVRQFFGDSASLNIARAPEGVGQVAVASESAMRSLGLTRGGGSVTSDEGVKADIVGTLAVPDYLTFLEPLVITPEQGHAGQAKQPVSVLVVIASRPDLVTPVSRTVQSLLAVDDPKKVQVSTSESLAKLRGLVQGQLGSFGRSLVLAILALSVVLVSTVLYALVMLRRKDFGRRRALGASQGLIVALQLSQVGVVSLCGAIGGTLVALGALAIQHEPLPGMWFSLAIAVLAVAAASVAALFPALVAAGRDPLTELRVP